MLKLSNHTRKSMKLVFCAKKNDAQISGFALMEKAPSPSKNILFK